MERADVISLLGRLKQAYPQAYAKMTRAEAEELVSLWSDMLGNEDPAEAMDAVNALIAEDTRGFPPEGRPSACKDQGCSFPASLGGVDEAIHRADSRTGGVHAERIALCERTRADVGSGSCQNGRRCAVSGYRGGIFKCPFYSRDYRDYLNCEGAQVKLPKEELDEYTRRYCANEEWRRCPIARALTLHYERTENR